MISFAFYIRDFLPSWMNLTEVNCFCLFFHPMQLLWACDRALESRFTSWQPFCSFDSVIYFCSQGFWVRNHSMLLQTVLCIPLMDGVLELGTTDRVSPWLINLQELNPTIITGKLTYISCLMLLSFWVNIQNLAKWDHWHTHFSLSLCFQHTSFSLGSNLVVMF